MPWIWSAGGDISDPDQTKASGYLDSDKSVAGVQFLVDLYKEGQIPNAIIGNEGATKTQDGMPNGGWCHELEPVTGSQFRSPFGYGSLFRRLWAENKGHLMIEPF